MDRPKRILKRSLLLGADSPLNIMLIGKPGSGIPAGPVVLKEVLKQDLLLDNLYEFI